MTSNKKYSDDYINDLLHSHNVTKKGVYVNNYTPFVIYCNKCQTESNAILINVLSRVKKGNSPCPICNNLNRRLSNEIIDKRLEGTGFERIGNYVTANVPILWRDSSGYEWKDTPAAVLFYYKKKNGVHNRKRITDAMIDERLKYRKIKRIGCYVNKDTPIEWQCLETGEVWKALPNNIFRGYGNPNLKTYKRERDILQYFRQSNIPHDYHKTFVDTNRKYIVDFFIPDKNCILEYNGKQHYCSIDYFGGEDRFIKQRERDENLKKYCVVNNINLVEIPYSWSWQRIVDTLNSVTKGG